MLDKTKIKGTGEIMEFIQHSNFIEGEYSPQAFDDAMRAWKYAFKDCKKIDPDYVLHIHRLLQKHLRPDIAGEVRHCDVWIGGQRKMYISNALIKDQIRQVIDKINAHIDCPTNNDADNERICKAYHIEFEGIHPFEDGNGRVGRILYNIHRLMVGLPIHIIHEGDEQYDYYKWFRE